VNFSAATLNVSESLARPLRATMNSSVAIIERFCAHPALLRSSTIFVSVLATAFDQVVYVAGRRSFQILPAKFHLGACVGEISFRIIILRRMA